MHSLCFIYRFHLPYSIKKISFFEFGEFPGLIDDRRSSENVSGYLNRLLIPCFEKLRKTDADTGGKFHFAVDFSGMLLEMIQRYIPEKKELIASWIREDSSDPVVSPWFHPVFNLKDPAEIIGQVLITQQRIHELSGRKCKFVFGPQLTLRGSLPEKLSRSGFEGIFINGSLINSTGRIADSIYRTRSGYLNLMIPDYKSRTIFNRTTDSRKPLRRINLKSLIRKLSESVPNPMFVPIDLDFTSQPVENQIRKLDFINYFVMESLAAGNLSFRMPSEILRDKPEIAILPVTEESLTTIPGGPEHILVREAVRYLESLEADVKKTGNQLLLYLWRVLQSAEPLEKLLAATPEDKGSLHGIYLDFMNALSSLDIYTRKELEKIN